MPRSIAANEEDYQLVNGQRKDTPDGKYKKEPISAALHRILAEWKDLKTKQAGGP